MSTAEPFYRLWPMTLYSRRMTYITDVAKAPVACRDIMVTALDSKGDGEDMIDQTTSLELDLCDNYAMPTSRRYTARWKSISDSHRSSLRAWTLYTAYLGRCHIESCVTGFVFYTVIIGPLSKCCLKLSTSAEGRSSHLCLNVAPLARQPSLALLDMAKTELIRMSSVPS